MNKNLSDRLKEARTKAGLTQGEAAEKLGIAYPTLSKYEQGHRIPDAELLNRMTKEFNCDPGWLLTGEGSQSREEKKEVIEKTSDYELEEIIEYLKEYPQDKKLILKLLKGKKDIKEALEGFGIKNLLTEEG